MPRGKNIPRFRRTTLTRGIKIDLRPGESVADAMRRMQNRGLGINPRPFSLKGQGRSRKNKGKKTNKGKKS